LEDLDRTVFARLSTTAATFDLEAATAVSAGDGIGAFEVLDALGRLVDKSILMTVRTGAGIRYQLLETLRQFGADRLVESGQAGPVLDRGARYWRDRARLAAQQVAYGDRSSVFDAIDADIENYRAAFAHLLGVGEVEEVARGVLALEGYWQSRRTREGLAWLQQLLTYPNLSTPRRLRALAQTGQIATNTGDLVTARRHALEAVDLAEATSVEAPWAATYALVLVAAHDRDHGEARRWW
jgi:predicted ATPase